MRTILLLPLVLASLAGCATTSPAPTLAYGNFVANAPATHEKQLADDAARQLHMLYPPATTHLELRQASDDSFGRLLVELLRNGGYALQESRPVTSAATVPGTTTPAAAAGNTAAGVQLNYVLDTIASPKLYRLTLTLGSQTLTRAYIAHSDAIHPAGAWVRKESGP